MNIISPNFIDYDLNFQDKSFLIINDCPRREGGVFFVKKYFDNINWIKPSDLDNGNNYLNKDNVSAFFINLGDGAKRTAINYKKFEIDIDLNFSHLMYGDYFNLANCTPNSVLSVDFAGLAERFDVAKILNTKNVRIVFCSDHDKWADDPYLKKNSLERLIIWHSPDLIKVFHDEKVIKINNPHFVLTNRVLVGAGDIFAIHLLKSFFSKEIIKFNDKISYDEFIIKEAIIKASRFVKEIFFA